jgi:molybdopterin/thiamine biosynthesis adenylyltransferase
MASRTETPLFYNATMLFSDEGMEKIASSTVAVAGVGGVGAVATEMIARLGVERFKIADPDRYEAVNLNRQIFATRETFGRNKAVCAAERIHSINERSSVEVFEEGVRLANVEAFCDGADVILCQCDRESSKVLLHRAAKARRIPLVSGGRSSIHAHRWKVKAKVYNYRDDSSLACYDEVFHPDMQGVPFEELTEDALARYDGKVRVKDRSVFRAIAIETPELFASLSPEALRARVETTERLNKRTVCSVIANTAGCFAATLVLKVLLGGPETELEINLWDPVERR